MTARFRILGVVLVCGVAATMTASAQRSGSYTPASAAGAVTIDDPTTWTKPWTFAMPLTHDDSEPLQLYECHEGNHGLKNILSAARAEERASNPAGR